MLFKKTFQSVFHCRVLYFLGKKVLFQKIDSKDAMAIFNDFIQHETIQNMIIYMLQKPIVIFVSYMITTLIAIHVILLSNKINVWDLLLNKIKSNIFFFNFSLFE
jgi:hypothetical protein